MLHKVHRMSGIVIGLFVLAHLINHVFILSSVEDHIKVMELFRTVYRLILVEMILIICVVFQVVSGVYFVWKRRRKRHSFFDKIQALSGFYLAFFLINHLGAVFYGRIGLELDTNIYYGVAGMHISPFQYYFIPYYFLAVLAMFIHLAAAFNFLSRNVIHQAKRERLSYLIIFIGAVLSSILIMGFLGLFSEIAVPGEYSELYKLISQTFP